MSKDPRCQEGGGHGHVYSRTDGYKHNCGGPRVCAQCASDERHAGCAPEDRKEKMLARLTGALERIATALEQGKHN